MMWADLLDQGSPHWEPPTQSAPASFDMYLRNLDTITGRHYAGQNLFPTVLLTANGDEARE